MHSCTLSHATPRLLLRPPAPAAPGRYGGDLAGGPSSPAGLHRRPWLGRLRRALQEEMFVVHYQPIVSLEDGTVAHYEALVRLADEAAGRLVAPGRFLPAAERYGLIREIDRLVLDRVAALLGDRRSGALAHGPGPEGWVSDDRVGQRTGPRAARAGRQDADATRPDGVRVAINLSALSVTDGTMLAHIERGLARHGVDPRRLVIEVTETAAISDMSRARAFCAGVRALGCAVALDDFGAGFGSFQYLRRLPFDYLKIDGSFVRSLESSPKDQLVVQALADLARKMGKRTIAEYVGDRATLRLLRRYGVDYAQGFEIGRPHPACGVLGV
ncbi:MAG TPA: EAL domain-containing protein [Solirubrobacteraceae bacterium]|nr:EAL domain-containing protein [Solirubrobacteraceae bacterium]